MEIQTILVRQARPTFEDAQALHRLEAATLGDSQWSVEEMHALLKSPEHRVYLAQSGCEAIGFCATFDTLSPHGWRLEVDMLGVLEPWRNQGVGTQLVQTAVREAQARGVWFCRAVVAQENIPSQRVFERCGFRALGGGYEMLVYPILGNVPQPYLPRGWRQSTAPEPQEEAWPCEVVAYQALKGYISFFILDGQEKPSAAIALLPVHTFAYKGVWVEAQWARCEEAAQVTARAAVEKAKTLDCDEVGFLLPEDAPSWLLWAYVSQGFQRSGRYIVMGKGPCD